MKYKTFKKIIKNQVQLLMKYEVVERTKKGGLKNIIDDDWIESNITDLLIILEDEFKPRTNIIVELFYSCLSKKQGNEYNKIYHINEEIELKPKICYAILSGEQK